MFSGVSDDNDDETYKPSGSFSPPPKRRGTCACVCVCVCVTDHYQRVSIYHVLRAKDLCCVREFHVDSVVADASLTGSVVH